MSITGWQQEYQLTWFGRWLCKVGAVGAASALIFVTVLMYNVLPPWLWGIVLLCEFVTVNGVLAQKYMNRSCLSFGCYSKVKHRYMHMAVCIGVLGWLFHVFIAYGDFGPKLDGTTAVLLFFVILWGCFTLISVIHHIVMLTE